MPHGSHFHSFQVLFVAEGLEWIGSYDLDKMALQLMVALTLK